MSRRLSEKKALSYLIHLDIRDTPIHQLMDILTYVANFLKEKSEDERLDHAWLDAWKAAEPLLRKKIRGEEELGILEFIQSRILKATIPIDEECEKLRIRKGETVVFLLGAGASAPSPSNIPTVGMLLPQLWRKASKIGSEKLDRLIRWCNSRRITNIEELLTAAYLSKLVAKNRNIIDLLDYFLFLGGSQIICSSCGNTELVRVSSGELVCKACGLVHTSSMIGSGRGRVGFRLGVTSDLDVTSVDFLHETLETLFGLLISTMLPAPPNPAHDSIVEFVKNHHATSIITTNYDGCMDEALLRNGVPLSGTLSSEDRVGEEHEVELLKMHGSIHWSYCESCQDTREYDFLWIKEAYEKDIISFPVRGVCKQCGGLTRILLVPPLSFKFLIFPALTDIWSKAKQRIVNAKYLIVIGYSFSEADTYISKMISLAMSKNQKMKMIVFNTDFSLVSSLREKFSKTIDNFDEKRILRACGNCKEILPKLLVSMLEKPPLR